MKTFITAEIGINHNGSIDMAKKLIDTAVMAGCDAVKFRKKSGEQGDLETSQETQLEYPLYEEGSIEFGKAEYDEIDAYCREKNIDWYASAYDIESQLFLRQYNLKYNKVASPMLVNDELLETVAEEKRYTFMATGMSTYEEIDHAVEVFRRYDCPFELMHCVSAYPMVSIDANLRLIHKLNERYQCKVGYSGHEIGTLVSVCAVAMGATSIERHITLSKMLPGKEQKLSIEPGELWKLIKDIREAELIMGNGEKVFSEAELMVRKKFRR